VAGNGLGRDANDALLRHAGHAAGGPLEREVGLRLHDAIKDFAVTTWLLTYRYQRGQVGRLPHATEPIVVSSTQTANFLGLHQ
jgi:hypothetical protein